MWFSKVLSHPMYQNHPLHSYLHRFSLLYASFQLQCPNFQAPIIKVLSHWNCKQMDGPLPWGTSSAHQQRFPLLSAHFVSEWDVLFSTRLERISHSSWSFLAIFTDFNISVTENGFQGSIYLKNFSNLKLFNQTLYALLQFIPFSSDTWKKHPIKNVFRKDSVI